MIEVVYQEIKLVYYKTNNQFTTLL